MSAFVGASIFEDNSGIDEFNLGNWSTPQSVTSDNIDRTGEETDSWLASNGMHIVKESYSGRNQGSTAAPGFVGIYKGQDNDVTHSMDYTFTAPTAMTQQMWQAKGTIFRIENEANSGRLHFSVNVNNAGFVDVATSGWFGRSVDGANYDMGAGDGGYGYDGPLSNLYTTDLSAFNIQQGDSVVYRFSINQTDALPGTDGRRTGIGVQLIPEPGTLLLFGVGGLILCLKRRRT